MADGQEWVMEPFDIELYGNVGQVIRTSTGKTFAMSALDLYEDSESERITEEAMAKHAVECVNILKGWSLSEAEDVLKSAKKLKEMAHAYVQTTQGALIGYHDAPYRGTGDPE